MRRTMPVPAGIIRPKTLGLKRAVAGEPETSFAMAQLASNKKARFVGLALFLFPALWVASRSALSKEASELAAESSAAAVASASLDADDDDDDGKEAAGGNDAADDASEDDDGVAGDDDAAVAKDGDAATADEDAPAAAEDVAKASGAKAVTLPDKTLSVESYFVNFGGAVVDIDKEGSYKYALVKMTDKDGKHAILVRGCPHKEGTHCYHNDAFKRAKADLEGRGYKAEVLGGGRITRHPARKSKSGKLGYVSVFGYSKTFGACADCNKQACVLIKQALPDYGVKWATEGYLESDERKIRDEAWTKC